MIRASLAALLAAAALALVPVAAQAQDAGGNQYIDPLAGSTTPSHSSHTSSGSSSGTSATNGASGTSSSSGTSSGGGTTTSSGSTATASAATRSGLPRTGFPVGFLSFAGAMLVSCGLALRRVGHSTLG